MKNLTIQEAKDRIKRLEELQAQVSSNRSMHIQIGRRIEYLEEWIKNHSHGN